MFWIRTLIFFILMPFLGNIIGGGPPTDGGGPLESSDNPGEIINSDSADITIVVQADHTSKVSKI